ncbi:MAG: hydantoinase/oxoprolinase family protein [Candidatus Kryptonium sp.]
MRRIKIGIDVGGTFTHAVAIDVDSLEIVAKSCVPTTHFAKEGVALGVIQAMNKILNEGNIDPDNVILIAHSTTQATNALLEGDVAKVGVIGMGTGIDVIRAKGETNVGKIPLGNGKFIETFHTFIDSKIFDTEKLLEDEVKKAIEQLTFNGAEIFVVSEAFGVDDPSKEEKVVEIIKNIGKVATPASMISKLYGLRVRTRTAVVNASMLPRMIETAEITSYSVKNAGIKAPLMIMRSDGGIMTAEEMAKRPIMTILSGPAAGVASALMYVKIIDGIFVEVGGTSTDISVIKNGKPIIRSAEIGGNKLYIKTLDVRTLGIAGGSMIRVSDNFQEIIDVGPRSAHIAGLKYVSFSEPENFDDIEFVLIQPKQGDPSNYIAIKRKNSDKPEFAITTTDAANFLNLISQSGYSRGNYESVKKVFTKLSQVMKKPAEIIARDILDISVDKVKSVVMELIKEYKLDAELITIVGGGGGAEVIVPYLANKLGLEYKIAENSEVISAIGAALGMVRESIERVVPNPTEEDILKIRNDVVASAIRMGSKPETIQVAIEIDRQTKRIIAVATGTPDFKTGDIVKKTLSDDELYRIAEKSFKSLLKKYTYSDGGHLKVITENNFYKVFGVELERKKFLFLRDKLKPVKVFDTEGNLKLQFLNADVFETNLDRFEKVLSDVIDRFTIYGDAGAIAPDVFLIYGPKIIDLTGVMFKEQMLSVARAELKSSSLFDERIIIIAEERT